MSRLKPRTAASCKPAPVISAGVRRPCTSVAATTNGRLYCAASVSTGTRQPSDTASWNDWTSTARTSVCARPGCVHRSASTASAAGCVQRHTGIGLKYCSRMRQREPRSRQSARIARARVEIDGLGRRAGEAVLREIGRTDAGERAHRRAVLQHRRMLDDAHQRRARAVVLGDAERVRDLLVGKPQRARADRRRGERIPRARRMHRRRARVERDARARADLVAEQHEAQELVPIVERKLIRERERGRDHGNADMSFAQRMAVVRIVAVDDRRARHRGAGNADAPSVENQARAAAFAHSRGGARRSGARCRRSAIAFPRTRRPACRGGSAASGAEPRREPQRSGARE